MLLLTLQNVILSRGSIFHEFFNLFFWKVFGPQKPSEALQILQPQSPYLLCSGKVSNRFLKYSCKWPSDLNTLFRSNRRMKVAWLNLPIILSGLYFSVTMIYSAQTSKIHGQFRLALSAVLRMRSGILRWFCRYCMYSSHKDESSGQSVTARSYKPKRNQTVSMPQNETTWRNVIWVTN